MAKHRFVLAALALILVTAFATPALAAPSDTPTSPAPFPLAVTPTTVHAGSVIHVSASGLANLPIAGTTAYLGILGPGQNVELNRSPQFRPQIGMLAVTANGTGQTDVTVPVNLVSGSYRVILGGCSPHGSIAPLATIAQATITVVSSSPAPASATRLPATGGLPSIATALSIIAGFGLAILGVAGRRRLPRE